MARIRRVLGLARVVIGLLISVVSLIKLILSPVFQYQLTTSRRVQAEQRRIAPQLRLDGISINFERRGGDRRRIGS